MEIRAKIMTCNVCNSEVSVVMELPKFPMTGLYVKPCSGVEKTVADNALMFCSCCGHGQLKNVIDPLIVYDGTYTHRSSTSAISRKGNNVFSDFIKLVSSGNTYRSALDVGCNDGYLLGLLKLVATKRSGLEPTPAGNDIEYFDGATIHKGFIEDVRVDLLSGHDLVVSSHTFEHVQDPKTQIRKLLHYADPEAMFFITVPCLDSMILNGRWDQVFHQHINYFSLSSMSKTIASLGCRMVSYKYDMDYWGGTLMVAFKRGKLPFKCTTPTIGEVGKSIQRSYGLYSYTRSLINDLVEAGEVIVGVGAAQMYPTLDYHLEQLSNALAVVYDDNKDRAGLTWPGKSPLIYEMPKDLKNVNVVITAPDSSRDLMKRCIELGAKRIISLVPVI